MKWSPASSQTIESWAAQPSRAFSETATAYIPWHIQIIEAVLIDLPIWEQNLQN
jgi:hypothetical protein